jgi:hypothetical protein
MAAWPKGRLMALEAPEEGSFTTVGIVPPGKSLRINAVTRRAGNILVEAADLEGKPLADHAFDDAIAIVGDQYRQPVRWKKCDDLGVEKGQPVVLRFRLNHARIYALEFE